ncbi:MAG: host attachment family protein [Silicimonas sp.]|jgi:protein required for attachment to host cells|nr:host attachment family protein [Silicimonas sp.]
MTDLKTGTWVLIADGEKAMFLQNDGDAEAPDLNVRRLEENENPPTREQAANRRGRVFQSANVGQSAYDDTDWHEFEKERFAKDVADILYEHAHKGMFDKLVVVASPQVLGILRDEYHKEVQDRVIAEIPKTLTNHPLNEIERMVAEAIA